MLARHRQVAAGLTAGALAVFFASAILPGYAGKKKESPASVGMSDKVRAVHALNRLTFGPKPGDVDKVTSIGVDRWIELQLHPEKIDDGALEARLSPLRVLRMNTKEMVENFPPPPVIRAVAEGRESLPSDPTKRAIYTAQVDRFRVKESAKQESPKPDAESATDTKPSDEIAETDTAPRPRREADPRVNDLLSMPPDQRAETILRMNPEDRRALLGSLRGKREELLAGMTPQQKETTVALQNPQQVVADELVEGKLLSATYSERQLDEVMTDFWLNHFNVFIGKGQDRYFLVGYERDVIRPRALGKFEDLLVATAESPAMLFYLDNWLSIGPDSEAARGIPNYPRYGWRRRPMNPGNNAKNKSSGLNENYGRELMELHTLGVNGGYTQKDVTEVARVFTGWTLKQPRQGGGFTFNQRLHEPGDKLVLDQRIKSNGQKEGLEVLHILAHHPATAKFVCNKLAMRFVSDDPPAALVTRMSQTFLTKDGDIREVLRTMFASPEFWAADTYRAKVKTPLEFVVSSLRASGADVTDAAPTVRQLQNMGMPLYGMQPPTGYSMQASTWVNSSALLGRMNFALALTSGRLKGTQVDTSSQYTGEARSTNDPSHVLANLEQALLAGDVSKQTHDTIAAHLADDSISQRKLDDPARPPNTAMIEGLLLGSPEFQRR